MVRLFISLLVLGCVILAPTSVKAHSEFKKMFEKEYSSLKVACEACHVKKQKKDVRNEFGIAIHKSVEAENFSEKLKAFSDKDEKKKYMEETVLPAITKSMKKVIEDGKDESGAKWSDLIKDGKLPGTKPN